VITSWGQLKEQLAVQRKGNNRQSFGDEVSPWSAGLIRASYLETSVVGAWRQNPSCVTSSVTVGSLWTGLGFEKAVSNLKPQSFGTTHLSLVFVFV